jgi:hypothetical protein
MILFVWMHHVGVLFLVCSIPQAENIIDFTKSVFFSAVCINSTTYSSVFILLSAQIEDLIADLSQIFNESPEAGKILIEKCQQIVQGIIPKNLILIVCIVLGIIGPLLTGTLSTPIYTPVSLKSSLGYYLFSWMYANVDMIYLGLFTTACIDLFFELHVCIEAYVGFFESHLRAVNFAGANGHERLIECIEIHRNVKR